ncbi:MAG: hypothetical protein GY793_10245 [Proteobacteria bacterium]|nr:hypothetical protein [Pseudomonadota bacterium]
MSKTLKEEYDKKMKAFSKPFNDCVSKKDKHMFLYHKIYKYHSKGRYVFNIPEEDLFSFTVMLSSLMRRKKIKNNYKLVVVELTPNSMYEVYIDEVKKRCA